MQTCVISAADLKVGDIVRTPDHYFDENGDVQPMDRLWPDAPRWLRVARWDMEEGESDLETFGGGVGGLDLCTMDYPPTFERIDLESERARLDRAFRKAGFADEHTGGGCRAWVRERVDGGHDVVTCADGSCLPDFGQEACMVGQYQGNDWYDLSEAERYAYLSADEILARYL